MRIPEAVCVMGQWVEVTYHDEILYGDNECDGIYCSSRCEIKIHKELKWDRMKQILIHELTHCVFDICGLDEILSPKQQEAVCKAMERSFGNMLNFNNEYVRWIEIKE